jgi:NADPH:quinone reductase-like Zn-dependent oxidoreductase
VKAVRYHRHGGPEVLAYEEAEPPRPEPDEVVVAIRAASVNHLDIWLRRGLPGIKVQFPRIPGADGAGVVTEVGRDVRSPAVGQRVLIDPGCCCWRCEFCGGGDNSMCPDYSIIGEHEDGCYAEFVAVPAANVLPIPDDAKFETAAAATLVYLTAWRMLVTRGRLRAGEEVLILGAGAGVGTACLQIARLTGARVIGAASTEEKCERLRRLGADATINTSKEDFAAAVRTLTGKRGVDVVVDYIGKDTWAGSLKCLRRGGRLVTCGATSGHDPVEDLRHVFYRQLEIIGSTMGSRRELLHVLKLVFAGKLTPIIDRVMPLKDAARAHELIEQRQVFGKIVLTP